MKRTMIVLSVLLAMLLVMSAIAGCGTTGNPTTQPTQSSAAAEALPSATPQPTIEPLKDTKIVMYLVGDAVADAGIVYDEVNKKLKTDINATVEVKYLSWADWQTKYSLIFASGEDFDCIYTAYWAQYADMANKKGFLELGKEMLMKSMPDYYAKVPADFWDQVKVGGKVFMIPYLNKQVVGHNLVMTRGDLAEKYNIPVIKALPDLENYVKTIKQNEPGMLAYNGNVADLSSLFVMPILYKQPNNLMILPLKPPVFSVALDDVTGKVNYIPDDPKFLDLLKKTKEYSDAGWWPKDILASTAKVGDNFKAGTSMLYVHQAENMILTYGQIIADNAAMKPVVSDLQPDKIHEANSATRSGMAIHATSKNVERTLMMLNLFGTHKDYYDLTTYGIVGKHFEPIGDSKYKSTELGIKNFPPTTNCPWGWENKAFMRYPEIVSDSLINLQSDWIKSGIASTSPVVAFNFVDVNVKNELAACDNIWQTEAMPLIAGLTGDPEVGLKKLSADLKAAGIEKVQTEIQTQMTAYLASLK